MPSSRPVIVIPADRRMIGGQPFHGVGEKYIAAIIDGAGALPLLLPALGSELDCAALLANVDGVLFTGSPSNVEPHHYAGAPSVPGTLHDPHRDATTLPLMRIAIDAGVPVLGICRGFQEMNVVFGGSLHQRVQEVPGFMDHRDDESEPLERQYGPAHDVQLEPGGLLQSLSNAERIRVNSLHSQGVDRLGAGLDVEARAPDGLIEAFKVRGARAFALAVQWHPEWEVLANPLSHAVFRMFGSAAREHATRRS